MNHSGVALSERFYERAVVFFSLRFAESSFVRLFRVASVFTASQTVIFYFYETVHFLIYSLMVECNQFHREESLYAA